MGGLKRIGGGIVRLFDWVWVWERGVVGFWEVGLIMIMNTRLRALDADVKYFHDNDCKSVE